MTYAQHQTTMMFDAILKLQPRGSSSDASARMETIKATTQDIQVGPPPLPRPPWLP